MYKGTVFNIQRFCTSDGPGIRTTVFLKGCPLDCAWCHNPESKQAKRELFFTGRECIACGACAQACSNHTVSDGVHTFRRENCVACGACSQVCPTGALEMCGEEKTAQEVVETALRDMDFYENSGGGLTLSGGEPLLQWEFALEILRLAKEQGLHTAVETCGFAHFDLTPFLPYVDLWLFDIKHTDARLHKQYTGVSNEKILENLRFLDASGAHIILRCPIIPGVNMTESHFDGIAALANSLAGVQEIHLSAYHPLGISKAEQLGKTQTYDNREFLEKGCLKDFAKSLSQKVNVPVKIL